MSEETKKTLERVGLIPVLRASSKHAAHALVDAMMAGGVDGCRSYDDSARCLEHTARV